MSDPINDDDNDGVNDVLVDEDDDHHDFVDDVFIDVDVDDDDNDNYDARYDVLTNGIHFSSTTFEWLNGIKKKQCQWFAIYGKNKFCFVG